ncbi:MAG: zinc ribbon domain-containing protein [Chloroflexota bacterium]
MNSDYVPCPSCQIPVPLRARRCPTCQTALSRCEECGGLIPLSEMVCRYCGTEYYDDEIEDRHPEEETAWKPTDTRLVDLFALVTAPIVFYVLVGTVLAAFTSAILLIVLLAWVAVFGTIGALIAPRKGLIPRDGFLVAGTLGIFGVAYLALKEDI